MEKLREVFKSYWLLAILLSLPAAWALLVPGFFGASDDMHIAWLYEMDRVLRIGQIPPRFVPDLSFGFGYPLFNFVFPLPFYLAEAFHLVGFNLVDSIKVVFGLSIPLSAVVMYFFLKEFTKEWLALAAALLYVYTPYRATDLYVRGAIGEIVAFVLFPLVALSIVKLAKAPWLELRWVGLGSLFLTALVLSHNIATLMFFPFILGLAVIWLIFTSTNLKAALINLGLAIFLGLLTGSYFWLPAFLDSHLMKYDTVFNFADHFPTFRQLVTPNFGYGGSIPGPGDGISFYIGTINLGILILGLSLLLVYWKRYSVQQKVILIWAAASFLLAFLMMNYRSIFLWNHLPLLPYFQFPWRFLMMTTFITPIFFITLERIKFHLPSASILILLTVVLNVSFFRPQDFLGRLDEYYLNRYIPIPKASSEYRTLQEEYLRLPQGTRRRPDQNYPLISASVGGEIQEIIDKNDLNHLIKVSSRKGFLLNYNKYLFPGWEAQIDGQPMEIKPGAPFGQIQLLVPAGWHEVRIYFTETNFKRILDTVSLLGLLLSLLLIFPRKKKLFQQS